MLGLFYLLVYVMLIAANWFIYVVIYVVLFSRGCNHNHTSKNHKRKLLNDCCCQSIVLLKEQTNLQHHPIRQTLLNIVFMLCLWTALEDTARYAGLLLAPAEGFGLWQRLFLPFGQKKTYFAVLAHFFLEDMARYAVQLLVTQHFLDTK